MNFDTITFQQALSNYTSMETSWVAWQGLTGKNNMVLEYSYNDQDFRTWNQEFSQTNVTLTPLNLGLMVSCKIDYERSDQDDHIIIMTGFMLDNNAPKLCFAQALIEFTDNPDININTGPITSGDISQGIYDTINTRTAGLGAGRADFPYIAKANIDSIAASIS